MEKNGTNGCEALKQIRKTNQSLAFFEKTLENKHFDAKMFSSKFEINEEVFILKQTETGGRRF